VRIVLDTNVVLSALLWRGMPHLLLATIAQQSGIQLCSSPSLLEELAEVLSRPRVTKRLNLIGRSALDVLADYLEVIELVEPDRVPRVVVPDLDDDQVIAAAVAARADLIVTGDRKHLLPLGRYQGIDLVDAGEAMRRIAHGR
jgi:putative PIN family toxin of toxin-antitoxin system